MITGLPVSLSLITVEDWYTQRTEKSDRDPAIQEIINIL